jgi:hypothetical protein
MLSIPNQCQQCDPRAKLQVQKIESDNLPTLNKKFGTSGQVALMNQHLVKFFEKQNKA